MANAQKMEANPICGKRILELIKANNLTRAEFAKKIGYSSRQVARLIDGETVFTPDHAWTIMNHFPGTSFDWLMGKPNTLMSEREQRAKAYKDFNEQVKAVDVLLAASGFQIDYEHPYSIEQMEEPYCNIKHQDVPVAAYTSKQIENMVKNIAVLVGTYMENLVDLGMTAEQRIDDYNAYAIHYEANNGIPVSLKEAIASTKMSIEEFAGRLYDVSPETLKEWEEGKASVPDEYRNEISALTYIPADRIDWDAKQANDEEDD